jgi:streptogramin lyase
VFYSKGIFVIRRSGVLAVRDDVRTEFPTPTGSGNTDPLDMAVDPNGITWFMECIGQIGRLDPATGVITEIDVEGLPREINIARISPTGAIMASSKVVQGSEPLGITVAPDGNPWFTMLSANKIATLQLR